MGFARLKTWQLTTSNEEQKCKADRETISGAVPEVAQSLQIYLGACPHMEGEGWRTRWVNRVQVRHDENKV